MTKSFDKFVAKLNVKKKAKEEDGYSVLKTAVWVRKPRVTKDGYEPMKTQEWIRNPATKDGYQVLRAAEWPRSAGATKDGYQVLRTVAWRRGAKKLDEKFFGNTRQAPNAKLKALHETLRDSHTFSDPKHVEAIEHYTGNDSRAINDDLHSKFHGHPERYGVHSTVGHLDTITKMHKAPTDFHVYTGLHNAPFKNTSVPGKQEFWPRNSGVKRPLDGPADTEEGHHKAVLPGFTSTSISKNMAAKFARGTATEGLHVMRIHVPKGSNHGAYVAHMSPSAHEREFLLRRGTKLHIHPEPEVTSHEGHKVSIWHARIAGNHYDD